MYQSILKFEQVYQTLWIVRLKFKDRTCTGPMKSIAYASNNEVMSHTGNTYTLGCLGEIGTVSGAFLAFELVQELIGGSGIYFKKCCNRNGCEHFLHASVFGWGSMSGSQSWICTSRLVGFCILRHRKYDVNALNRKQFYRRPFYVRTTPLKNAWIRR